MSATARTASVADAVAATLAAYGVKRIFGVPGGGSSLEIIAAAERIGLDFVLCHGETSAAIMAAVTAELGEGPGVVLTGLGPGAASVVNGCAYAHLDRAPILVITDSYDPPTHHFVTHQKLDHSALLAPISKGSRRLTDDAPASTLAELLEVALAAPRGPVHVDLSARAAGLPAQGADVARPMGGETPVHGDLARAGELLRGAEQPAVVVGMQARDPAAAAALRDLEARLDCPVVTTYKAKGVRGEGDPAFGGMFTGGKAEAPWLADADLILLYGLDPVELVAQPWPYEAPVVEIAAAAVRPHYLEPAASLFGPIDRIAAGLLEFAERRSWRPLRPTDEPETIHERRNDPRLRPGDVVNVVRRAAAEDARLTVDAGAHMLPAMNLWRADAAHDVLISNGLSTMGFALPAAIAAALADPTRRVTAFIGDGGLMMCAGELATAARNNLPITLVVFNDAALSMIDLKQQQRGFPTSGVRYPAIDFATMAHSMGCRGFSASDSEALESALADAASGEGPAVIDVAVDPSGYRAEFEALRGGTTAPSGG